MTINAVISRPSPIIYILYENMGAKHMPITQGEKRTIKLPHNIVMEDRKSLMITGVSDVDSFDDATIVVYTDMGELTVRGADLHIGKLNVETGELSITGQIIALGYTDDREKGGGFFSRLFK